MRDILFRGLTKTKTWMEGWFCGGTCDSPDGDVKQCSVIIGKDTLFWFDVDPDTIGQYIRYTVSICQEKERYKAMITVTNEMRNNVIDQILSLVESVKGARIINSSTTFKVMFDNVSSIYVAPAYESTRGQRAHLLVVDDCISRIPIQNVLRPCEVMDWSEHLRKHRRDEE